MSFLSAKKLLLFGFIAALLTAIPLTVFFLQNQTRTKSGAEAATTICFSQPGANGVCLSPSSPVQKQVGELVPLDIYLDPSGKNKVIVATISINYDNTKLEADPSKGAGLGITMETASAAGEGFTSKLVDPTYTTGNVSVTYSVGIDVLKAISTKTKIATITFKALAATDSTNISFDQTKSNATSDVDPDVNVLSSELPASVKIVGTTTSPTTIPSPTQPTTVTGTPTTTPATSTTPSPTTSGTPAPNQLPICTGLNVDRATSGSAPFSITFTANGNDPDGTISSVTFDFGDGPVETVTTGGGIGSKTASIAKAHTYNNPATFVAKATFTDSKGSLSAESNSCKQTITVTSGTGGTGITTTTTPSPTLIVIVPQDSPTPLPKKEFKSPPGPGDTILGVGGIGATLVIIGTLLFFAL